MEGKMSNTKFSVSYDSEKLTALQQYCNSNDIENELIQNLEKIYIKKVPSAVRKYIENKNSEK